MCSKLLSVGMLNPRGLGVISLATVVSIALMGYTKESNTTVISCTLQFSGLGCTDATHPWTETGSLGLSLM
jgi:hypothetical protein